MNTELSNKIEIEEVECSLCDTTITSRNNIYIANNQKKGDKFEEDTLCESCWYANKRQYKADGWGGDDLESSCDESANDSDDESEDDAEERETRVVDEDEFCDTKICELCEEEDVWTNYCYLNHMCSKCVERQMKINQNRNIRETVCCCPFCNQFGMWCDKCGHKQSGEVGEYCSRIETCNGKLYCVSV